MRTSRLFIALATFVVICVLAVTTPRMRVIDLVSATTNSPPVAGADTFTGLAARHQGAPGVLGNDFDPDGDHLSVYPAPVVSPLHGNLNLYGDGSFDYSPNSTYDDTDSFTYQLCDSQGACVNGVATLVDANHATTAGDDTFSGLGARHQDAPGVLANDSDPDGDPVHIDSSYQSYVQHGYVTLYGDGSFFYNPAYGYLGPDSFSYRLCDQFGACSIATVTLNDANSAPVAGMDLFFGEPTAFHYPAPVHNVLANDYDSEGDQLHIDVGTSGGGTQQNGYVTIYGNGDFYYAPPGGLIGTDSFTYQVCDNVSACSTGTVTLLVIGDGENDGVCSSCNKGGPAAVGGPVNVTNGNMYLQQGDYSLPGVGYGINVTRTYNSNSQTTGLFGRGWSSEYDQSIIAYDNSLTRFNQSDGRATYFGRQLASSGAFASLEGDFHGSLVQNGGSGFTVTMVDGSVRQFNSAGKLVSLADRTGNQTTLTYDTGGKLASVTDPFGRVLSFTTNANGQVLSIADTLGTIATYTYGGSGQLLSVTYADNSALQFSYDGNYRLTTVTDALGNVVESHTYDGQGRAISSERQGGIEHYGLDYVSDSETDVTDALSHVTKYTVDKSKGRNVVTRVEGFCSCGGGGSQVQTWTYDNQLNVTAKTDALNHVVSYTYDANGNRLSETDALGTTTFTYNNLAEVLTAIDKLNGVTTNTYDSSGNLLTTKDALNNTTTLTYNTRGQVLTATDARGKVTTFTYDTVGNLTQSKDANNISTSYFYDARSRLTKVRDGLSRSTLYAYDPVGRVSKVTYPDLSFIGMSYDLAGRRTVVTDERGNPTNYAYDGAYRLTSITDAANHATTYGYDPMSNLTSVTDALSRTTNYDFDDFNRLVKTTYAPASVGATRLFETLAYDAAGNITQRIDTAGGVTGYTFDAVNRLAAVTNTDNKTTTLQYDTLSRITSLVDAINQRYEFVYDVVGQPLQIKHGTASMSFVYDEVGNRTRRTDYNGVVTDYSFDNLNRLTTIAYPSRTSAYGYDPLGNLTRATNENGSVYIGYDNRYRISSFSDPFFYGISYNYDGAGNRTKVKVNGATYASYSYDAVNRLTNLKDAANLNFNYAYDSVNRLLSRSAPNGVTSTYNYDDVNRLTGLAHASGAGTLINNQYSYNDRGEIANWSNGSGSHAYSYDPLGRLTSTENSSQPNEHYSYDGVGNRNSSHLSLIYGYQPFNHLASTATATYSFDNNGNLISKTDVSGTTTYAWNEDNQLTQVTIPTGVAVSYKYDAMGRRIQRTNTAGSSERYVYDGHDVVLDLNADWSVAATYLNDLGIDNHLRQSSSTTGVSYYLTDHLNSTAGFTDAAGSLVEQLAYDSFGNTVGSGRSRYSYSGRERDSDTGLFYYRARFYDPQLGRFISEDPLGITAGLNQYAYVENEPTGEVDPLGLQGLPPLTPGRRHRIDPTRNELEGLMNPGGQLPDDVRRNLDRGCIGLTAAYQGAGAMFPEDAPGTKCYLRKSSALAGRCGSCCTNFVFAKQGQWTGGRAPRPGRRGVVPNGSISSTGGGYNYVVYFPTTHSYAWMDHAIRYGDQHGSIADFAPNDPHYPHTIWCSTCKRRSPWEGLRGGAGGSISP